MNRELIRCSEGYWNLVNDRGRVLCRFKTGDKVRIKTKQSTEEGLLSEIVFSFYGTKIGITQKFELKQYNDLFYIEDIISMEVEHEREV